jgi:hypothetical protein
MLISLLLPTDRKIAMFDRTLDGAQATQSSTISGQWTKNRLYVETSRTCPDVLAGKVFTYLLFEKKISPQTLMH